MSNLEVLEGSIGYSFKNKDLLSEALTHASFLGIRAGRNTRDNSFLALLGNEALRLAVMEEMVSNRIGTTGTFTKARDAIVCSSTLFEVAELLNLISAVRTNNAALRDSGRGMADILASAFEAVAGAVMKDGGYPALKGFARKFLFSKIDDVLRGGALDPKSLLQQRMQKSQNVTPVYRTISESGPDHDKTYTVGVYSGDTLLAKADGPTKREAEKSAAMEALRKMGA